MLSGDNNNVQPSFDVDVDFEGGNYKSCFARSVVVNSNYQQTKNTKQPRLNETDNSATTIAKINSSRTKNDTTAEIRSVPDCFGKSRRDCVYSFTTTLSDCRRNSNANSSNDSRRSSSACSSRIAEMPVQNLVLKSQIETLQWQLKQTEASREMYRAVMKQVVTFLERAHRSLQILGSRLNSNPSSPSQFHKPTVPRVQSDYNMTKPNDSTLLDFSITEQNSTIDAPPDYTAFRDFTWRRQKKPQTSPKEIPPEKLSQEAFRLLRTAQSLLNTRAPDLAHLQNDTSEDLQFLEQLAREFPRPQEDGTHRPNSRCSSLQLPMLSTSSSDKEIRIATALNRKLSLQQNKRNSKSFELPSNNDCPILSSTLNGDFNSGCRGSITSHKSFTSEKIKNNFKLELEKSNSPPMSSVSSAEDESGFSSMNSFQELGIPVVVNPMVVEEKTTKEALLKSMLQGSNEEERAVEAGRNTPPKQKDLKLWQRPDGIVSHKRWSSVPVDDSKLIETQSPLKVLWV